MGSRDTNDDRRDYLLMGEVIRNDDPEKRGRIQVLVKGVYEPDSVWVESLFRMFGVKNGIWWVPEVGSNVAVWLHQGDQDFPFYLPGPFGAPDGVSDVMDQVPDGSVDHLSVRWRDFHVTFNGKAGEEKLTIEDLGSGTKIEIDRPSGGNYIRDVENDETITVKNDRSVTVEEGNETKEITQGDQTLAISQGKRTTTIQGDDVKTLTAGDETKTLSAGSSTESMPAGNKSINAGLAVSVIAGTTLALTAGGAATLTAAGISLISTGTTLQTSTGAVTKSFLGGVVETIVGAFVQTITGLFTQNIIGAYTLTVTGIFTLVAAALNLGSGPYKAAVNEDIIAAINALTFTDSVGGTTSTPIVPITPGGSPPFKREDMVALTVKVS